jgi:hypothetical protein
MLLPFVNESSDLFYSLGGLETNGGCERNVERFFFFSLILGGIEPVTHRTLANKKAH